MNTSPKQRNRHHDRAAVRAATKIARAREQLAKARQELAALVPADADSHLVLAGKWRDPADALEQRRDGILALPGVVACGLGHRNTKGMDTREPALVIFVQSKLDSNGLIREGRKRLPRFVRVDGRRVPVDVVEMKRPQPQGAAASIGPANGVDSGTIGCLAFDAVTRKPVLITAGHVTGMSACTDPGPAGEPMTVPALFDNAGSPVIGTVSVATTFGVDAAKITVNDGAVIVPFLPPLKIFGVRQHSDDIDVSVSMFGKMSGLLNGVIKYIGVTIPELCLEETLLVSIDSRAGDSGAGLVDSTGLLVGFLYGLAPSSVGDFKVFCPASRVMVRLGCTIS